jgi:hypothetical protein
MPVHPAKVQAQKDIEAFKRLLAELKAGAAVSWKGFGSISPQSTSN